MVGTDLEIFSEGQEGKQVSPGEVREEMFRRSTLKIFTLTQNGVSGKNFRKLLQDKESPIRVKKLFRIFRVGPVGVEVSIGREFFQGPKKILPESPTLHPPPPTRAIGLFPRLPLTYS